MHPGRLLAALLGARLIALAQADPREVSRLLEPSLHSPDAVTLELRRYLIAKAPALPQASARWLESAPQLRQRSLRDVIFHGWPQEWTESPARFEDLGVIAGGHGYRMRKLRYEIVRVSLPLPSFMNPWSCADVFPPC